MVGGPFAQASPGGKLVPLCDNCALAKFQVVLPLCGLGNPSTIDEAYTLFEGFRATYGATEDMLIECGPGECFECHAECNDGVAA